MFCRQDDAGLTDFHEIYFPFPLYRDEALAFYEAFESGTFMENMSWNPVKLWKRVSQWKKRLEEKNIPTNLKGDGYKSGGILIIGKDGTPKYMYKESAGLPIEEDVLLTAVRKVREEQSSISSSEL